MRIQLPESDRRRQRRSGATAVSVTVHAAVILLVAHQTVRGDPPAAEVKPPLLVYHHQPLAPLPTLSDQRSGSGAARDDRTVVSPLRRRIAPPLEVPTGIPELIDRGLIADLPISVSSESFSALTAGDPARDRGTKSEGDTPLSAALVERAVRLLSGAPRYPASLQARGEEGYAIARFVVDTTGRVEVTSVEILDATNEDFSDAVRDALRRMRFAAAEAGGRRVRQLVEQRFEFRMR